MVNTRMFVFKHPKYYTELRKRNKSDQVISKEPATAGNQRAPGPGHKPQAPSSKHQASSSKRQAFEPTCSSAKRQASQPE